MCAGCVLCTRARARACAAAVSLAADSAASASACSRARALFVASRARACSRSDLLAKSLAKGLLSLKCLKIGTGRVTGRVVVLVPKCACPLMAFVSGEFVFNVLQATTQKGVSFTITRSLQAVSNTMD